MAFGLLFNVNWGNRLIPHKQWLVMSCCLILGFKKNWESYLSIKANDYVVSSKTIGVNDLL